MDPTSPSSEHRVAAVERRQRIAACQGVPADVGPVAAPDGRYLVAARGQNLRSYLKPVQFEDAHGIRVDAKTGTLNFVSSLAGYITAKDGRELVFAILTADEATRKRIPREQREGPPGARSWANRSRALQRRLVKLWAS